METKEKIIRITETDFFLGIFAVLALRDYKTIFFNEIFEESMVKIFQEFMEYTKRKGAELCFRIRLHPFHGDSEAIYKNISFLAGTRIITLDSPGNRIIRIKLTKDEAGIILNNTITQGKLFIDFADRIINIFSH